MTLFTPTEVGEIPPGGSNFISLGRLRDRVPLHQPLCTNRSPCPVLRNISTQQKASHPFFLWMLKSRKAAGCAKTGRCRQRLPRGAPYGGGHQGGSWLCLCSKGGRWLVASQPLCGYGPPLQKLSPPCPGLAVWVPRTPGDLLCRLAWQLELSTPSQRRGLTGHPPKRA